VTEQRGKGRRQDDRTAEEAMADLRKVIEERNRLVLRTNRFLSERVWTTRILIGLVIALLALNGYMLRSVFPDLRRGQDANVCVYRSIANREALLSRRGKPADRATHRRNARSIRAYAVYLAQGNKVKCRPIVEARG
jgi:hypothetical protein